MQLVTPDIGLLFWMLVSFLIVFFLLKKFAWKPILSMLHNREETIEKALQSAEKAKEEMQRLQADNEKILDEARMEREKIFRDAQSMRERIVAEAREQAKKEKDRILDETRLAIQSEKAAAIKEIRETTADLSVKIAEKLLRHELSNDQQQKELIDQLTKDISIN